MLNSWPQSPYSCLELQARDELAIRIVSVLANLQTLNHPAD